ncbi:hypothetical protein DFP94_106114 [Fontibacillus phaseoli]|uniref:Uncharacterized protein n=1 Tax=Fontibacillus phaseoli TaxID=1416533 RepID=A0A369BAM8_9BACL|nr:hypothetical protein [Fontibacillus phaseoli]RCX18580.1 hypothetical protein DFP94_106114 [Fontibacillus phaseoli]
MINSGETNEPEHSYKLAIIAGEQSINCIPAGQEFNSEDVFKSFFTEEALSEIKNVKINERLLLKFEGDQPNKVIIKDILLSSDGKYLYPEKLSPETLLTNKDENFSFVFGTNLTSGLSSQFEPTKRNYRGFKVNAAWESRDEVYIFVIKEK